jgi:hypothetical protein
MKLARGAQILVLAGAFLLALVAPAAATTDDGYGGYGGYGNEGSSIASGTETVIYVGTADEDGKFRYPYQVPAEVESSFDIFLRGTADDGGPFEYALATVTPSFAGRTVVLTGQNLEPGSEFTLFAVSDDLAPAGPSTDDADDEGTEAGTSPADGGTDATAVTEQSLADLGGGDSSNRRIIGGVMVVALLIAAAVVYGLRLAGREAY